MAERITKLKLHIEAGDNVQAEELETLTLQLREELLDLDVETVELSANDSLPTGAKAVGAVDWSTLVLTLVASGGVITTLLNLLSSWMKRHEGRKISVEINGDKLEVTGSSPTEQKKLIDAWINRHVGENKD